MWRKTSRSLFSMPEPARRVDSGAVVRSTRIEVGLTLRQLAAAVGVSTGTMSAIENGKVGLTVDRLRDIAHVLGVPAAQLLHPQRTARAREPRGTNRALSDWRAFHDLDLGPVLTSAVGVFHDTGYHGATMRLIAAGADISVAGIYHHYPSKRQLLLELTSRGRDDLRWRLDAAATDGRNTAEAFGNMVEALVLFREERRSLAFVMVTESSRAEPLAESAPEPEHSTIRDLFDNAAALGIQTGEFSTAEPQVAVTAILTMCLTPSTWIESTHAPTPAELARTYARLSLTMLGNRNEQDFQVH